MKLIKRSALALAILLPLSGFAQEPAKGNAPVDKSAPAVTLTESVELQGIVTAIVPKTRSITVKGAAGNEITFTAGPQVKNFKQIKLGDVVTLNYQAALALDLRKGGGRFRERIESEQAVSAPAGAKPAGGIERTLTVIADVTAVDAASGTITLRGPQRSVELAVKDKDLLRDIRVGDQIAATYREAVLVAVTVAPPPAAAMQ